MSQLNLKQILSGDDLSAVVEKINYNFNQVLLNGGGAQGLQGIIGPPGLPGVQGTRGVTGNTGSTGTHIFVGATSPSFYSFGTGSEPLPRLNDIYLETAATYITIYERSLTGTSLYWNQIQKVQSPLGPFDKTVGDAIYGASATWANAANNPAVAGKALIGSPDALYGTYVIDPSYPITSSAPRLRTELSGINGDSLLTLADSKNHIRLLDHTRSGTRAVVGGGIVHSYLQDVATTNQIYRIFNNDTEGDNYFSLRPSSNTGGLSTVFFSDLNNKIGIGLSEFFTLVANATINTSLAVGSPSSGFLTGLTFNGGAGALIEGNLAIGRNNNGRATLGVFKSGSSSLLEVDTDVSAGISGLVSRITIGSNLYNQSYVSPGADFTRYMFYHDANSNVANAEYRSLKLTAEMKGIGGYTASTVRDLMAFSLTASPNYAGATFTRGLVSVGGTAADLFAPFEVGERAYKVGMGQFQGSSGSGPSLRSFLGFNLNRNPILDSWIRRGNGTTYNTGSAFWFSPIYGGIALSTFGTTGGGDTFSTDTQVFDSTKFFLSHNGRVTFADNKAAELSTLWGGAPTFSGPPMLLSFPATGTTGSGYGTGFYRRYVALMGYGTALGFGSPLICATNGITQSSSTQAAKNGGGNDLNVAPHYTWANAANHGLYISRLGSATNGLGSTTTINGLAVDGEHAVTAAGTYAEVRVGINQDKPLERFQIGNTLTYRDANYSGTQSSFFGYNLYYNRSAGELRRIAGSTASGATHQGAFSIQFFDNSRIDGAVGATMYSNLGTKLVLTPFGLGGTVTSSSGDPVGTQSVIISPPALGPSTAGWTQSSSNVPMVSIGLSAMSVDGEKDGSGPLRRGTLAIAAQERWRPSVREDRYNIGLYSYNGLPGAGIYTTVLGTGSRANTRTFGINMLGLTGSTEEDDAVLLDSNFVLQNAFARRAWFGANVRLGINTTPTSQASGLSDTGHNVSALDVFGYTQSAAGINYGQAILSRGSVIIDTTSFQSGTAGLFFKNTNVNSTSSGATAYPGDWVIRYSGVSLNGVGATGLNITKPSGSTGAAGGTSSVLFLSDTGSVGVGTLNFSMSTGLTSNALEIVIPRYSDNAAANTTGNLIGYGAWDNTSWASMMTVGGGPTSSTIPAAKLAVNGIVKLQGFLAQASDTRLKTEIARVKPGEALSAIKNLEPVLFTWNENSDIAGHVQLGFFAQEVKAHVPEAVSFYSTDKFEDVHQLDYNTIFTMAVGAIKDQQRLIDEKDLQIKNLETKLSKIEELLAKNNIT